MNAAIFRFFCYFST
ncbi:pheST operon leader peptide PheM [Escherichia coli]